MLFLLRSFSILYLRDGTAVVPLKRNKNLVIKQTELKSRRYERIMRKRKIGESGEEEKNECRNTRWRSVVKDVAVLLKENQRRTRDVTKRPYD